MWTCELALPRKETNRTAMVQVRARGPRQAGGEGYSDLRACPHCGEEPALGGRRLTLQGSKERIYNHKLSKVTALRGGSDLSAYRQVFTRTASKFPCQASVLRGQESAS